MFRLPFLISSNIQILMQRMKDLDTPDLLEHLPALQQLLHRVLGCQVAFMGNSVLFVVLAK